MLVPQVNRIFRQSYQCVYVCVCVCEGPGVAEADENCRKFMDKTMVDAFIKVGYPHDVFRRHQVSVYIVCMYSECILKVHYTCIYMYMYMFIVFL